MLNRLPSFLGDGFLPVALFVAALFALALALVQLLACLRHARAHKPLAFAHRGLWMLLWLFAAALVGSASLALRGYRLLTQETLVATISTRRLAPQQFEVAVEFPDGRQRRTSLHGDEWQLDVRVIKWKPGAVLLDAPPLFHADRLAGRYRDSAQAQSQPQSLLDLGSDSGLDAWMLKQRFPQRLPWVDADYGSSAYLPMLDGARYAVTLSPLGGLVARPADAETALKLGEVIW